jgi:geranylgeranyl diphosphate synthase type II
VNENLAAHFSSKTELLQRFFNFHFETGPHLLSGHRRLYESVRYSVLQEGGKRFRPVLAMLAAEALGSPAERVLPFAAAVECVHTYSLIHDDLPAMDNDDVRRGQPTNHRKFDEATAILAGDALLTDAFRLIGDHYSSEADIAVKLVVELAQASGLQGMVGGQAIDMASKKESITLDELALMHQLKTGALIRVSATGAAIACRANAKQQIELTHFAENLGLAFQVADDVLDYDPKKIEPGSYPAVLGLEPTKKFLHELTEACLEALRDWPVLAEPLREIARYNKTRIV